MSGLAQLRQIEEDLALLLGNNKTAHRYINQHLRRAMSGLKDPQRPISFVMFGNHGELQRKIIHRLAMFLSQTPSVVETGNEDRIVGEFIRQPNSVIVFPEIELLGSAEMDRFLKIRDEGRLRNSLGSEASFSQAILVATTFVASDHFPFDDPEQPPFAPQAMDVIVRTFRPDFLRSSEFVVI